MPARYPTRRRSFPRRPPRRRVDNARTNLSLLVAAGATGIGDPLARWLADQGLSLAPAGCTVGPLKYRLSVISTVAQTIECYWGFIVGLLPSTLSDLDPLAHEHLDWMEWGGTILNLAANTQTPIVSFQGDDGFRQTRTRRKVREIEDRLSFAVRNSGPSSATFTLHGSTAVMLP